jgi:hypothetical protein
MGVDQTQLGDLGLEAVSANPILDSMQLSKQIADPTPLIAVEVAADPGTKVVGLSYVDELGVPIEEHVNTGRAGKSFGEMELLVVARSAGSGKHQ